MKLEGNFTIPDDQIQLGQQLLAGIAELNRRLVEPFVWLTAQQAAERLGVSESTIRNWLDEGWLTGVQVDRILRFRSDKLDAAFEKRGEFRATHPALLHARPAPKRKLA